MHNLLPISFVPVFIILSANLVTSCGKEHRVSKVLQVDVKDSDFVLVGYANAAREYRILGGEEKAVALAKKIGLERFDDNKYEIAGIHFLGPFYLNDVTAQAFLGRLVAVGRNESNEWRLIVFRY